MKKTLMVVVMGAICIAGECAACDAERITLIPGLVLWATGCCDNDGRSWVEIKERQYLYHSSKLDRPIVLGGIALCIAGGGWTIRRRLRRSANQAVQAPVKGLRGIAIAFAIAFILCIIPGTMLPDITMLVLWTLIVLL